MCYLLQCLGVAKRIILLMKTTIQQHANKSRCYLLLCLLYFDMFRVGRTHHQEITVRLGAHCESTTLKYKIQSVRKTLLCGILVKVFKRCVVLFSQTCILCTL